MNIDRLTLMATMLDEVANHTWRPTSSAYPWDSVVEEFLDHNLRPPTSSKDLEVHFDMKDWGSVNSCGYCACAIGHALLDERFAAQGFGEEDFGPMPAYEPDGQRLTLGWDAVQEFFDIPETKAVRLFGSQAYEDPTPAKVAERIREVINQ